jgi:formylglycine-generating enzyme required for sulfatase activity/serine/threonine protein kinase
MAIKIRPNPAIPDHEVLRKIGGGAYGEVWLARGVTGALRAVKVVWREDFEDARGFEREFEGILKFEPISRDHPALMNILHVGRSPDSVSFYYYVMELGDDVISGRDINPIEYEPRTLRADHQATGVQWDTNVCIDVGLRLAEALDHLHELGLAHRDVKPSNVIFVNGRAKLADIGLVATRGQRTFVGTEGFVPPEGPGSAQADVYSLGKVLYEIATGKDRLAFPELPDQMPEGGDRKRWLELNKIICDICEPRISKRKISTAADLADALRRLQRGKRRRHTGLAVWMTTFVLAGFFGWVGWEMVRDSEWLREFYPPVMKSKPVVQIGMLKITSSPEGAEVFDKSGKSVGTTNTGLLPVTVGQDYFFTLKKAGYRPVILSGEVPPSVLTEPLILPTGLQNYTPPLVGERWEDQLGNSYMPKGDAHESFGYIRKEDWEKFARVTKRSLSAVEFLKLSQNGKPSEVVLASAKDAAAFCDWFRDTGYDGGYLTLDQEAVPIQETTFENASLSDRARKEELKPFRIRVRQILYGSFTLTTHPSGVEVFLAPLSDPKNGVSIGGTDPDLTQKLKPGSWQLTLVKEGFTQVLVDVTVGEGQHVVKDVILNKSLGVVFGKSWENSLGMKFEPLGPDLMVSAWETRVRDYQTFVRQSKHPAAREPEFPQTGDHPVVNVSRDDAQAFCVWLTKYELAKLRIAKNHVYRLPTDLEWSLMVGLQEEPGISPGWRDARKPLIYPWGTSWPPDRVVGNFADISAAETSAAPVERTIPNYNDGYAYTAPVGSYPPNSLGLYDLSGNVQEWVEDEYSKLGKNIQGVLRGGSWNSFQSENLMAGSRNGQSPSFQDSIYGFRVVLAREPTPKPE